MARLRGFATRQQRAHLDIFFKRSIFVAARRLSIFGTFWRRRAMKIKKRARAAAAAARLGWRRAQRRQRRRS